MIKNDDFRTAQSILLLLFSIFIALGSSFFAGNAGYGLLISRMIALAGYVVGLIGALREAPYARRYRMAAATFLLGIVWLGAQQIFSIVWHQDHIAITAAGFAINAVLMIVNFAAMRRAVDGQLRSVNAPEAVSVLGRRWVLWTAIALPLTFVSTYMTNWVPASWKLREAVQMLVLVLAFALMVSALIVGVKYLLHARKFFLTRSGRNL